MLYLVKTTFFDFMFFIVSWPVWPLKPKRFSAAISVTAVMESANKISRVNASEADFPLTYILQVRRSFSAIFATQGLARL